MKRLEKVYITYIIGLCVMATACPPKAPQTVNSGSIFDASLVSAPFDLDAGSTAQDSGVVDSKPKIFPVLLKTTAGSYSNDTLPAVSSLFTMLEMRLPKVQALRVRLFDGSDRLVESHDSQQTNSDDTILYVMSFETPLIAGHSYVLVVDSGNESPLQVDSANRFSDFEWKFRIDPGDAGTPSGGSKHRRKRAQ